MEWISQQLGWRNMERLFSSQKLSGGMAVSNLLLSDHMVFFNADETQLFQVTIDVTKPIHPTLGSDKKRLQVAFKALIQIVSDLMGFKPVSTKGMPLRSWDLPTGGRIQFHRLDDVVIMKLLSKLWADNERWEEARNIPPDLDPSMPLYDAHWTRFQ
jgi:hypothetical protein